MTLTLSQRRAVERRDERTREFRDWNALPASEREPFVGNVEEVAQRICSIAMDEPIKERTFTFPETVDIQLWGETEPHVITISKDT